MVQESDYYVYKTVKTPKGRKLVFRVYRKCCLQLFKGERNKSKSKHKVMKWFLPSVSLMLYVKNNVDDSLFDRLLESSLKSNDLDSCKFCILAPEPVPVLVSASLWSIKVASVLCLHRAAFETGTWLSTLGGAYSSLGDVNEEHAIEAGKLAFRQLRIAQRLQNTTLISQCWLFISYSYSQQGMFDTAQLIIMRQMQYGIATSNDILQKQCIAAWQKMLLLQEKRHRNGSLKSQTKD